MVVKKSPHFKGKVKKKPLSLKNVPIPPKKKKLTFPELVSLKKDIPLQNVPAPSLPVEVEEPFDLISEEHGLFKRFDLFKLRTRKVFPVMYEKVATEEPNEELPLLIHERQIPSLEQKKQVPIQEQVFLPEIAPDPWQKTQELLTKCRSAIQKGKLDYAQIFYEELKPFYPRLTPEQQTTVTQIVLDIQQDLQMLQLQKLKDRLKKGYLFS